MGQLVEIKKASVRIPTGHVSQGGAAGLKRLKGASEQAAQSAWKRGLVGKGLGASRKLIQVGNQSHVANTPGLAGRLRGKKTSLQTGVYSDASRSHNVLHTDELKLPVRKASHSQDGTGVSITLRQPDGKRASVTHAQSRTGAFAGKQRGVGRHLTRDENSSPGKAIVRTPSIRDINGKFAGKGPGVQVFHTGQGPGPRSPRDNRLQRWTKGGSKQAKDFVRKADDEPRKGMLGPVDLASMQVHAGSRVGRRIPLA